MAFKKRVIHESKEAIRQAEAQAQDKINILKSAIAEAKNHIEITYLKAFCDDFIGYTTEKILAKNKGLKDLNLTTDKVLNLLDIDLKNLYDLQVLFEENQTKIYFDKNGKPFTKIDKNLYTRYTKNDEENEKVKAIQTLINALEGMEKFVHIYKGKVQPMTSNIMRYCMRENDWIINQEYFK